MTGMATKPAVSAETSVRCAHCSLPVPRGRRTESGDQFCCSGCEAANAAIRSCGLEEYYALRQRLETDAAPAESGPDRFDIFDDPGFTKRHARETPGGRMTCELYLAGMHCAACVWLLERLPRVIDGLVTLEVDYGRRTARAVWDPEQTPLSRVCREISTFGYVPSAVEPSATRDARRREERAALVRLGVAGACAGNVMLIAFALYSGHFTNIEEPYLSLFRWLSAGIGVLSIAWPGRVFFTSAIASLRARAWSLDAPVALALFIGAVAGTINVARGSGEIYFDTLTMLVFLLLTGRWLQMRQQRYAHDAVELLFSVTPRTARVVEDDGVREIATDALEAGMLVEVRPDESIPADGVVRSDEALVDESVLTGESAPVRRMEGDPVFAGGVNKRSTLRVEVVSVGRETRVGQMMALIERLARSRTPIIGSADRIARPFVAAVLALAAITFLIHVPASLEGALEHSIALLIVCCPCAAALATPIATTAAIARLARRGTLVKGGDIFEAFAARPTLLLDKTGTVTDGAFTLRSWTGDDSLRALASAMEADISHPLATTLASAAAPAAGVSDIEYRTGLGVTAVWSARPAAIGSPALMSELGVEVPSWAHDARDSAARNGQTPIYIAYDGAVRAVAALGDDLRAGSLEAVRALRDQGWQVELLSGDAVATAEVVGERLGVAHVEGEATPERKHERVRALMADGEAVIMVGDGVNDASALASATVGVAVSGGAEASLAAADVYFNEPGLAPLVDLVRTGRRTVRVIRRCLTVAFSYNCVAAGLAMGGLISPLAAAVIMPISSLTVVSIAASRERKGPRS